MSRARLLPSQCCFVVDDVRAVAEACEARFGWGPFHHFRTDVPEAHYRGWTGRRVTDVALGMAGRVQVELVHVHQGREPIAEYQDRYGTGFQHLGVGCRSIEGGLARLEPLGASVAERNEHEGIGIAFVDLPMGPAMFELLQFPPKGEGDPGIEASATSTRAPRFALDRATVVTDDMDACLAFFSAVFDWEGAAPERHTLRYGASSSEHRRHLGRAGMLTLELVEARPGGDDPYAAHLARGDHGLVHAGGVATGELSGASLDCAWQETGERFALHDWAAGPRTLQVRHA